MKKSKILVIISLTLVLAIAAFIPSTFSWYNHDGTLTGDKMSYSRSDLPVSAGTVALETKKYKTVNNKLFYDEKGNKKYDGGVIGSGSVANGATQYYGTTITNTGTAPAYVNLYLQNFSHHPDNYIGTIAPSLTYKGMSSSVHLANKNMIRVYFQVKDANNWKDSSAKKYIVYKTKTSSSYAYRQITSQINNSSDSGNILNGVATSYVDLPENATEFYFATDGNNGGFNTSDCSVTQNWYRTNTITDIQAEVGYYLTGVADDTTWRAQYATFPIPGGVSVKTYFNTATIAAGKSAYITLAQGTNYTGKSAAYSTTSSYISVNGNTGLVTAKSTLTQGRSATVTTTITGSLGDTTTVTTTVSNPATLPAAAVALNVKVPGRAQNEDGEWENGKAEIVWYIANSSGAACSFNSIYYTK